MQSSNNYSIVPLALSCLVLVAIVMWLVIQYLDTPVAHFSHSTGECVEVLSKSGEYHCDNLPEKYTHVWVR